MAYYLLIGSALLCAAASLAGVASWVILRRQTAELQRQRTLVEQLVAGSRAETETTRTLLANSERALGSSLSDMRVAMTHAMGTMNTALIGEQGKLRESLAEAGTKLGAGHAAQAEALRTLIDAKLREMREGGDARLAEIQRSVNEQLHDAVEKQMKTSFDRVIDQFAAVQKAMGDVQAVTAQIGDIKRLFTNVKTRGGWGEAQVRAMLDDVLPAGSYEMNRKLREGSDEAVEFAVIMPMRAGAAVYLPVDAKFPVEDYERLLTAAETGEAEDERVARRGLEKAIREQAKRVQTKYINPPVTVEFAVMYLPTDGLYAEVARVPGLIDELGRTNRVLVLGPSLFPALLRTIHLGHVTLALEQKADQIRELLGATRTEMERMDKIFVNLGRQAGTFSTTIEKMRQRTRVVNRKLRSIEAIEASQADALLELEAAEEEDALP